MANMNDGGDVRLEEIGASVLDAMEIPRSLPNAKELALAVLERLYSNERVLKQSLLTMTREAR